jgi:hypothetical protein
MDMSRATEIEEGWGGMPVNGELDGRREPSKMRGGELLNLASLTWKGQRKIARLRDTPRSPPWIFCRVIKIHAARRTKPRLGKGRLEDGKCVREAGIEDKELAGSLASREA